MKNQTIPIKGMHCKSCEILITDNLEELRDIKKADVSLKTRTATIYANHMPPQSVIRRAIEGAGYEIGYDEKAPVITKSPRIYKDVVMGLAVVALIAFIFSYFGLTNLSNITTTNASAGLVALTIGVTAGFSTCIALIGGLVLGISARHAEKQPTATTAEKFRPHLFFNLGRIISFIIFGAVIGGIGSAFQLKGSLLGGLLILVGFVMLLLGLQLTELFPRLSNFKLTLPSGLAKKLGIKEQTGREYSHRNAMLVGGATFFLPCGFTQAMQLFAISTGSPATGALIMGAFALGTAPGLLGIGGLTSIVKGAFAQKFFRIVGVTVVAMSFLNIANGYNLLGLSSLFPDTPSSPSVSSTPSTDAASSPSSSQPVSSAQPSVNVLKTSFTLRKDIVPSSFSTKVGQVTRLEVDVKENGQGCMSTIMIPGLDNNPQFLKGGEKIILTFTPRKKGTYQITCAMGVPRGTLTVT